MSRESLDALRSKQTLKDLVEALLHSDLDDDFRLSAILAWIVEELEQTLLGPSPATQAAFHAGVASEAINVQAVMESMKTDPSSVPQPVKELFEGIRLHPNRWAEIWSSGFRKRTEIAELVSRPEWKHLAASP